jgi:MFS family permease
VRSTTTVVVAGDELEAWLRPWDGLVKERADGDGFACAEGPFRTYRRTVTTEAEADGRHRVSSTVAFRLDIPYFAWLFALPLRRALRRPGAPLPWWAPPAHLDARAARVLGTLCAVAVVAGFLGTSITQTITFAVDSFGVEGDRPQAFTLATVRIAILLALVVVAAADRRGRRRLLLGSLVAACALSATTALSPNLVWFAGSQVLVRGFSTAIGILLAVVAAEEMPAGARAFAASVLSLSAAFGAGLCVMLLPLADVGDDGWRFLFLAPLLGLLLVRGIARRLPESKRFEARHGSATFAGHGHRLALLAVSAFLVQLFAQPASQLQNEFLRDDRGYSAVGITLFTLCTVTPAGIGVLGGGILADRRGRRGVGAVALLGGAAGTVGMYASHGAAMWLWSAIQSIVVGAAVPALGVYGPELFPTALRARANGVLGFTGVIGSATGLVLAGLLADRYDLTTALAVLSIGPLVLAGLVLLAYPETAGIELEELNPEDAASLAQGP